MTETAISTGTMDLKQAILASRDLHPLAVPTPEWEGLDGQIHVRELSAAEKLTCADRYGGDQADAKTFWSKICALLICDAGGSRLFADEDYEALNGKSYAVLERIAQAGMRHNGLVAEVREDENLSKNSPDTPSGSSPPD